ncbi:MAG: RDD family protein [Solirubrobacteraceae bacterium]
MEYEDRVRISTPEGVDVELTLAGIGSRFIAAILDFIIQAGVVIAVSVLLGLFSGDRDGGYVAAVFSLVFFLTFFAYDVLFEVRSRGRTPGKRWTGLRVVRTGGRPVTFVRSCIRNVLRLVDILPSFYAIGMLSIFVTRNNQRLGDLAAGTYIVRERAGGFRRSREPAPRVATTAGASWDVSAVSAQDAGTVRQFLDRRDQLSGGARQELAEELERRLRPQVAGAPVGLGAEEFLEQLSDAKAARA